MTCHKHGGYIQTMAPVEETKPKTMMNTMTEARTPTARKEDHLVVDISFEEKADEQIVPKEIAARMWRSSLSEVLRQKHFFVGWSQRPAVEKIPSRSFVSFVSCLKKIKNRKGILMNWIR